MSAYFFKTLTQNDVTTSRTLLHEAIPITGTLVSGTYSQTSRFRGREENIKTYSHGMFQSVYDYPFQSSSANHIFDITLGFATGAFTISDDPNCIQVQADKKRNIYNQMAMLLFGHDTQGRIKYFDQSPSGNSWPDDDNGIFRSAWFLTFSRLLVKDEIKKGSFEMTLGMGSFADVDSKTVRVHDEAAAANFRVDSPAGEYALLKDDDGTNLGMIFYQAGVVMLHAGAGIFSRGKGFDANSEQLTVPNGVLESGLSPENLSFGADDGDIVALATIDEAADALRRRIINIKFNNTTELNSTLYFCRAASSEFNYSSNPTYVSGSKIRVKTDPGTNEAANPPLAYVTTVGLYSPDNELLAVAKLSEPIKKTPINELNFRVRLDF